MDKINQTVDTVVPYFYKAIDKLAEYLSPYVNENQLSETCLWLKENDRVVVLSTFGALTIATLYLTLSGKSSKKGKDKRKRSYKVKIKKEKVIPVDPIKLAYDTIKNVKEELTNTYIAQVDKLEHDVLAENKHKSDEKSNNKSNKKSETTDEKPQIPYKESTKYRYLYLNEVLLKLLMRLDSVEPNGIEDIRMQRKAAIKEVQSQCKRLDSIKLLM